MDGRLQGKVALITGAAAGIGRAAALAFAREGARTVVSDVAADEGEETARLVREQGGEAVFVAADVSRAADVETLVARAIQAYGRLDCAFNNAGVEGQVADTVEYSEESWDRTIAVNLKGVWLCMKYEIAQMLRQGGGGAIVNTSSTAGLAGVPGVSAYSASKHGVAGLTKVAALEYARSGVRVNCVCPGPIRTSMMKRLLRAGPQLATATPAVPLGRMGTPEEIAEAVVWLLSDQASFVTGLVMSVDGGQTAQ